ncbi:hypothetical protein FEM48_Zijuj09G0182800 [Ziziphus jujuba var. spinosa]|uniref:Laccase n=1 Tax=Ziziphus jujuba var. spinosa TaxID=714518 RepID=A0A978UUJ4_ZIZJJ|nr:hypothetical protein FEM48_Zijuj09G0182800 [Ziziphus jujuba var. spinosa]
MVRDAGCWMGESRGEEEGWKQKGKGMHDILTVNGKFPGPTLKAHRGDKMVIKVYNQANTNITLHWHGAIQPRNPWSDGPEYITQCPIIPGKMYVYKIDLNREEGTIWWHAHSGWARATVHGANIVYPNKLGYAILSQNLSQSISYKREWWKKDVMEIPSNANKTGGEPILSDAYTINGQPGFLYPCSKKDQPPSLYSMAAAAYSSALGAGFDKTMTTAFIDYSINATYSSPKTPYLPNLPPHNRTEESTAFTKQFRSLATKDHPAKVPLDVDTFLFFTISVNLLNCSSDEKCTGPFGKRFAASVNNINFVTPPVDILQAYYHKIPNVFKKEFPRKPPVEFNYTGHNLPENLLTPSFGTRVLILEYNASVELILQGTNVLASDNHLVHLHGYSFHVVGWGFCNFNPKEDPSMYNLVDPPEETIVGVPKNGWVAIRFKADNPGIWLLHCHIERHTTWGMNMVFLVKDGDGPTSRILPPPHDLPKC